MTDFPPDALSPHEYLGYLQHRMYGDQLPPFAADVGDVLTANLLASLPPEHRQQLEHIAIAVLPTKSVNAYVVAVPSGGEVIGFDFGALSFLLSLNKLLMSRITLFGFDPTLELAAAKQRACDTVQCFFGTGDFKRFMVSPRRTLIAASLSNTQTAFIVEHELGHVLLGHMRRYQAMGPAKHFHDLELAADERGYELVLNSFENTQNAIFVPGDAVLGVAGIDIFFTYMNFMRRVMNMTDPPSHPPFSLRQKKLRERFWDGLPENADRARRRAVGAAHSQVQSPRRDLFWPAAARRA